MKKALCFLMALAASFTLMACTENKVTTAPPIITTNTAAPTVTVAPTTIVPTVTNTQVTATVTAQQ